MPDTTTTNYGLTKMQVGAHRDDWGDVGNTNLDKIDAAIAAAAAAAAGGSTAGLVHATDGVFEDAPKVDGQGVFPHFADPAMTGGQLFVQPANGNDPTSKPGDIWFGYA